MSEPNIIDDDVEGLAIEAAAEVERKAAAFGVLAWQGVALEEFSFSRELMYHTMTAVAGLAPMRVIAKGPQGFLAHAVFILWLCRTKGEALEAMRHDARGMVAAAESWGAVHIGSNLQTEAMDLAVDILRQAEKTRAVHAPRSGSGGDSGNSPGL
ncbi:MAG: hypothetical protein QE274_00375 [Verrucomicrobiaceae bacterium]|nr:hypothetical protein [Verrucomicrobiaceae bacterium]